METIKKGMVEGMGDEEEEERIMEKYFADKKECGMNRAETVCAVMKGAREIREFLMGMGVLLERRGFTLRFDVMCSTPEAEREEEDAYKEWLEEKKEIINSMKKEAQMRSKKLTDAYAEVICENIHHLPGEKLLDIIHEIKRVFAKRGDLLKWTLETKAVVPFVS